MEKSAILSADRKYRYVLTRIWDETKPTVVFIGLNPSTADEYHCWCMCIDIEIDRDLF